MIVLGINGGVRGGYQDISAALVVDGQAIAAIEEERLSRVKHAPGQLPERAIRLVLDRAGVAIEEVDVVATHGITWGDTYHEVLRRFMADTFGACPAIERVSHHDAHAASTYFASGFDDAVILTADNSGDGVSTSTSVSSSWPSLVIVDRICRGMGFLTFRSRLGYSEGLGCLKASVI